MCLDDPFEVGKIFQSSHHLLLISELNLAKNSQKIVSPVITCHKNLIIILKSIHK